MSDAHYDKVSLLLPMFGSNNGTVFTDYSPVPKTITCFGDTKTVTAQSQYYGSSGYFDGSGDYLTVSSSTDFQFGSDDFTAEVWFYLSGVSAWGCFAQVRNLATTFSPWGFSLNGSNQVRFVATSQTSAYDVDINSGVPIAYNQWVHIAVVRYGNVFTIYINGVSSASITSSITLKTLSEPMFIGSNSSSSPSAYLNGYINDLRITNGVARYTSNFTPPARLVGQISGMVKDGTNTNAARIVKAIPRIASNSQIFTTTSAADGTYSLWAPCTEHSVIALDDNAGINYNDLVHRVIPI